MTNYYKVLGIQNFATSDEIKTAYRKLSKKFHPDLNQGDKFFEGHFKEIQSAYESLNDSNKRKRLDDYLKQTEKNNQGQNYQGKNDNETNRTHKNQSKEESKKNYSQTTTSETEKDNNGQQEQTRIPQKSNINIFYLTGFVLFIVLVVLLIISSKKENNNLTTNYNLPIVPSTYESNYIEPSIQQQYETIINENTQPISSNNYDRFSIGSSKNEVLSIQGNPTRTTKFEMIDEEIWYYNLSSVTFKNEKVNEYSDNSNILKVKYNNETQDVEESQTYNNGYFTIGSSKNEVLRIQGDPTRTTKFEMHDEEIWYYNLSSVTFKNEKVNEYSDNSNILKVKYNNETQVVEESQTLNNGYFSMGSSKNEVLRIQGDPTRTTKFEMHDEEIWYYNLSSVTFKNGKVNEYSDYGNILKVKY